MPGSLPQPGDILHHAVASIGGQRNFSDQVKADIHRELRIRARSGKNPKEASRHGTLAAATSWLLPSSHADMAQHRGASSYGEPFFAQLPRSQTEMSRAGGSRFGGGGQAAVPRSELRRHTAYARGAGGSRLGTSSLAGGSGINLSAPGGAPDAASAPVQNGLHELPSIRTQSPAAETRPVGLQERQQGHAEKQASTQTGPQQSVASRDLPFDLMFNYEDDRLSEESNTLARRTSD